MSKKMTIEEKTARAEARKQARIAAIQTARIEQEKNQKQIKEITITINWIKSRTWGTNPNAEACVHFKNGEFLRQDGFRCSGCGYDKESTVIAEIFDAFLKYKLWAMTAEPIKGGHGSGDTGSVPYGINSYNPGHRGYGGGIGTNCYYKIAEYLGGKFEHVASGKTFDVYKYTDNE